MFTYIRSVRLLKLFVKIEIYGAKFILNLRSEFTLLLFFCANKDSQLPFRKCVYLYMRLLSIWLYSSTLKIAIQKINKFFYINLII